MLPSEYEPERQRVFEIRGACKKQPMPVEAQAIANFIQSDEQRVGSRFLTVDGRPYLFTARRRQLLDIGKERKFVAYLANVYGLNVKEQAVSMVISLLESYAVWNGEKRQLRRWCEYRDGVLYLSNYNGQVWKVTGEGVDEDANGKLVDDLWYRGDPIMSPATPVGVGIENNGEHAVFADDDEGQPVIDPVIGRNGKLFKFLGTISWARETLGQMDRKAQMRTLLIWMFAIAFPDIMPTKPILIAEGAPGSGKCLGPETPVLKFDGSIVRADQVKVGDLLMGPDSKPRRVLGTVRDRGQMFRIVPVKGDPWTCNDVHVLTLIGNGKYKDKVVDVPLDQYLKKGVEFKHRHKLFQPTGGVDFEPIPEPSIDPYFLGLWFGDGSKHTTTKNGIGGVAVSKPDPEVRATCEAVAAQWGLHVTKTTGSTGCPTWHLVGDGCGPNTNRLLTALRKFVGPTNRIPQSITVGTRATRTAFLAGFLDADGHRASGYYEIVQKRSDYADAIAFIARSLGLRVTRTVKIVNGDPYHRLAILGHLHHLPLRILRKQMPVRGQVKDALRTGFTVEAIGDGEYAGFTLDGDGRFLLGDFTVTHNTLAFQAIEVVVHGSDQLLAISKHGERDFWVTLLRNPISILDNADEFIDWLPDALCAYATGAGRIERELHTNTGEIRIRPRAFLAVPSKDPKSFRRDDVADRSIVLRMDKRPNRSSADDILRGLARDRPHLFGEYLYYLNRIVAALHRQRVYKLSQRMADFEKFAYAVGEAFNWPERYVRDTMDAIQRERTAFAAENDVVAELLDVWVDKDGNEARDLTARELFHELRLLAELDNKTFIRTPQALAQRLRSPHINERFLINTGLERDRKLYRITRTISFEAN
jgi:hypothetical protein